MATKKTKKKAKTKAKTKVVLKKKATPKKKVVKKKPVIKKKKIVSKKPVIKKKVVAKKKPTPKKKLAPTPKAKVVVKKQAVVKKPVPKKVAPKKVAPVVIQKVKKCKKSLCKEPAIINGYCRYHYIAGWKTENIDKKVKKLNHLEKVINEIKKRFTPEYLELIKLDLASDEYFRKVVKDMDLEEDINDFEINDDTQKIIESYSSLVDLERED